MRLRGADTARPTERSVEHGSLAGGQPELCCPCRRPRRIRPARPRDRDHRRREVEQPGERDLGAGRTVLVRDRGEWFAPSQAARTSRAAERRVGDHGDPCLHAAFDQTPTNGAVVVRAECRLHCCDGSRSEGLVQLRAIDVGEPHPTDQALVAQSGQGADRGPPRRARIWRMDEVEVDRKPVEGLEACLAVRADRAGTTIRDPAAAAAGHAPLGDDASARVRAAVTQCTGNQFLVVSDIAWADPVRPSGVEHGHACLDSGLDRRHRDRLVAVAVR